jgi:hypothetical protein
MTPDGEDGYYLHSWAARWSEEHATAAASIAEVQDRCARKRQTGNGGPRQELGQTYSTIPAEMMVRGSDVPEVAMHGSLNKGQVRRLLNSYGHKRRINDRNRIRCENTTK